MPLQNIGFLDKQFFKTNYLDALKIVVPSVYFDEDINLSGTYLDPLASIINSNIDFANDVAINLNISATPGFPNIDTIEGFSQYFVKQNGLTLIDPITFEKNILQPLGAIFSNFSTSSDFLNFINLNVIPKTRLGIIDTTFAPSPSANHEYLIDNLGLFYLLNVSAITDPSSFIASKYTDVLYKGNTLNINDGIQILNYLTWSNAAYQKYVPNSYKSNINSSGLYNLNTLTDVIYNTLLSDNADTQVKDAFNDFINGGIKLDKLNSAGPFERLLKAFSFSLYDVNAQIELINTLIDIDRCPDKFLPILAQMIGWGLVTNDPNKWRLQLRVALNIYKAKGTRKSLQTAINTVIPTEVFNPVSGIIELYESYIPFLIYYALLTESFLFADGFNSWTKDIANSLGVNDYTYSSFDQNIRYAVDNIILDLVQKFPDLFFLAGKQWDLADPNFQFKYRGRIFPIPPWEEIKYYEHQFITGNLLQELSRILNCFGVRSGFVADLITYIETYTIRSQANDVTFDNAWLFFTPSSINPPNFGDIITDSSRDRSNFMTLWNGKSSHFRLIFTASSIDFNSVNYDASSFLSVITAAKFINEFSPFHAIPGILLFVDLLKDVESYSDNFCTTFIYPKEFEVAFPSGMAYGGPEFSGVNMVSANHRFSRNDADNIRDFLIGGDLSGLSGIGNLGRRSIRRRNYYHLLKRSGEFHRTGFDMPSPQIMDLSTGIYRFFTSSYIPLGFVPSTLDFMSPVLSSLGIYDFCEGYNSSDVFYGYNVSNTFPCRGLEFLTASSCDKYVDRGQVPSIIQTMFNVGIQREQNNFITNPPEFFTNGLPVILFSSYYNIGAALQADQGTFPSSVNDFYNFSFGRGTHEFYKDFTNIFQKNIITDQDSNGGFDIFSHAFGPLLYNGTFFIEGSALLNNPQYAANSFNFAFPINYGQGAGILSQAGVASGIGTYAISSIGSDFYVIKPEFRNGSFLSGVEFVDTSGASKNNKFELFILGMDQAKFDQENFFVENPLIKLTAVDSLPRLRFDLNRYGPTRNILIPDHNFNLNISVLPGSINGNTLGGSILGVWLHTTPENNNIWTFNFDTQTWNLVPLSSASSINVVNSLATKQSFTIQNPNQPSEDGSFTFSGCYENITVDSGVTNNLVGNIPIIASNFKQVKLQFNTLNSRLVANNTYYKNQGLVHRLNQNYVLEVFMVPNSTGNYYQLFDEISIIDSTENNRVVEYSRTDLADIIRFFNYCSEGPGSRVALTTSGIFDVSGGSRVNYRIHPDWNFHTYFASPVYQTLEISQ